MKPKNISPVSTIADCIICQRIAKKFCPYRDYPFNNAKIEYLDMNAHCEKLKNDLLLPKNNHT